MDEKKARSGEGASLGKSIERKTYAPRPFRGRGVQGAPGDPVRSVRERKVVLARHGHAAQQPFSESLPPQVSRISQLRSFYPRSGSGERTPENPGSNDVPAEAVHGRVSAEIGGVAHTPQGRFPHRYPIEHANARGAMAWKSGPGLSRVDASVTRGMELSIRVVGAGV